MILGETAGKEALKHHCAFLLDRSAQIDVAFDVDDPRAADGSSCGDPYWCSQSPVAGIENGERIYLPYCVPRRVDNHCALDDATHNVILDPGISTAAGIQSSDEHLVGELSLLCLMGPY